jgi:hypothetical protein
MIFLLICIWGRGPLYLGKFARKWCELGKDGKSSTFISLEVQYTPCPEAEPLATTANVTPKTTNSNSLLPNTASNDIQQHVNSANSGNVDIRNLTVTLIRTVVLQRSWYQMPGCSVQCKMNKNTHGYMTVWYTKGIYVSFVNCFLVILPHHKNLLLLALTLVQYDCYSITGPPN